jgi:hypothetical protein
LNATCRVVRQGEACGKDATCKIVFSGGDVQPACVDCALHLKQIAKELFKTNLTVESASTTVSKT